MNFNRIMQTANILFSSLGEKKARKCHFSVLWQHYTPGPLSLQFPLITIVCLCMQPCNMKQILIGAYSAVLPCESWMLVEALCLRSSWMRRWFPLADALCSGVESNLSVALGSAPFSSSIRAI